MVLPSSHCSDPSIIPFPHVGQESISVQEVDHVLLVYPSGQEVQLAAPTLSVNVPAGQSSQLPPASGLYEPAKQLTQLLPSSSCHALQTSAVTVTVLVAEALFPQLSVYV